MNCKEGAWKRFGRYNTEVCRLFWEKPVFLSLFFGFLLYIAHFTNFVSLSYVGERKEESFFFIYLLNRQAVFSFIRSTILFLLITRYMKVDFSISLKFLIHFLVLIIPFTIFSCLYAFFDIFLFFSWTFILDPLEEQVDLLYSLIGVLYILLFNYAYLYFAWDGNNILKAFYKSVKLAIKAKTLTLILAFLHLFYVCFALILSAWLSVWADRGWISFGIQSFCIFYISAIRTLIFLDYNKPKKLED